MIAGRNASLKSEGRGRRPPPEGYIDLDTGNASLTIFVSQSIANALNLDISAKSPKDAPHQPVTRTLSPNP